MLLIPHGRVNVGHCEAEVLNSVFHSARSPTYGARAACLRGLTGVTARLTMNTVCQQLPAG